MSVVQVEQSNISTRNQFAAALPALVGFTPESSLVIVLLKESKVLVTMRCDLPEDWESTSKEITDTIVRIGAEEVVIAVTSKYKDDEMPYHEEIGALITQVSSSGVSTSEAILVDQGRFWNYLCGINTCCPVEGTVIDTRDNELGGSEVGTREEVTARFVLREHLQPSAEVMAQVSEELDDKPLQRAQQSWEAVQQLASDPQLHGLGTAGDVLRAYVQLACSDVHVRDYILGHLVAHEDNKDLVDAITDIALRSSTEVRPRMCGTAAAALAATQCSTVPARCLAELADSDSLGRLVMAGITAGFPPNSLGDIFRAALPTVMLQLEGKEPK